MEGRKVMDSYKAAVPLGSIRLSETNPRQDMGDVAALARSIEATGGQPLNPPVVVADGTDPDGRQTYRVVDGERRVRALWSLYGEGSDDLVDVLCFRSYDAADEAVAMLATDDKRTLSPVEAARGFQRALMLDVDEAVVAKATRRRREDVARARRAASDDGADQASLDALVIAGEFDDPAERRRVIEAEGSEWDTPEREAMRIRDEHRRSAKDAAIRAAMPGSVEFRDGGAPYGSTALEKGLSFVDLVSSKAAAARLAARGTEGDLVAFRHGDVGSGYEVYVDAHGPIDPSSVAVPGRRGETGQEASWRHDKATHAALYLASFSRMARHALSESYGAGGSRAGLASLVLAWRHDKDMVEGRNEEGLEGIPSPVGPDDALDAYMGDRTASLYEVMQTLGCLWSCDGLYASWYAKPTVEGILADRYARLYDAMVTDGWRPTDDDRSLRAICRAEGGDEGGDAS